MSLVERLKAPLRAALGRPRAQVAPPGAPPRRRVLLVGHDAAFFGAQILLLNIAQRLRHDFAFDVATVLLGPGALRADFEALGEVVDFTSPPWSTPPGRLTTLRRRRALRRLAREGYRHSLCNSVVTGRVVPWLRAEGFRVVGLVHELPNLLTQFGLHDAAHAFATQAHQLVFPAEFVRSRFASFVPRLDAPSVLQPQGLFRLNPYRERRAEARSALLQQLGLDGASRLVVAAGSGDLRKGMDLFVAAAMAVARADPRACFVWAGEDQTEVARRCRAQVDEAGLADRVRFVGVLKDPDAYARLVAGADVYLMSSREDPFPSVVLDAMSVGVPVVGFSGAGGFETLLAEGAGVLVPMEDTDALAQATLALVRDETRAAALGARGRAIIDERFRFDDYVRDLLALLGQPAPRVSVIVPNYNYARYLPQRLASITGQTYRPFEIIFLDDHSSDDSVAVARRLLAEAGIEHRVVANDSNAGPYAQWLRGLEMARGELVWIAEADDHCEPTLLQALVPAFADPRVVISYCQSRQVDADDQPIRGDYLNYTRPIHPTRWLQAYQRSGRDEIADTLAIKNTLPNASAVLMRRPDLAPIREMLLSLRNAGDWLVYTHLLERGDIAFCPHALNAHRLHRTSVTHGGGQERHFAEILRVQRRIAERHALAPATLTQIEAMRESTYRYLGLHSEQHPHYRSHPAAQAVLGTPARREDAAVPA